MSRLIGIRIAVAVINARAKLIQADRDELDMIVDLANDIQEDYLLLRQLLSAEYQRIAR